MFITRQKEIKGVIEFSKKFADAGRSRFSLILFLLVLALSFWLPARANGALRSGVDGPATAADDLRADLPPPVRYPNNSFLGYRGLVAADINKGNDVSHMDEIVCDFGPLGLWAFELTAAYGGTWYQISGADADGAFAVDDDCDEGQELQVDFGNLGLWTYDGGAWSQISSLIAEYFVAANVDGDGAEEILVAFREQGLWLWNGGVRTQLSGAYPD